MLPRIRRTSPIQPDARISRLIGYLYGVTSKRKLVEELRMHLAWRWFTGLGFDQEIPHHSTFSFFSLLGGLHFEVEPGPFERAN